MQNSPHDKHSAIMTEEDFLAWIAAKVDLLHAEARVLVDDYWRRLHTKQKQQPSGEKARIGVRVRRRESCLSFSIEWFRMAMIRENGKAKPIAHYLKKGSGYRYPLARYLNKEPEWGLTSLSHIFYNSSLFRDLCLSFDDVFETLIPNQ